ncbi:MAG TPA: deoxyribodipyrimidine photo-lyase [Chthoniobacterales bacterium]|nr:deoxyribodipyrimidine photo-lyase [Chthoniobacterales bacterium]
MNKTTIFWFRQDLRLSDNPGLLAAASHGAVMPIYILDDEAAATFKMGAASRWWLHHSLKKLNESLNDKLNVYEGNSEDVILNIIKNNKVDAVYWNRCYEPLRIKEDTFLKTLLQNKNIECKTFNASLLWEPWEVVKSDHSAYKVFTPFYRQALKTAAPRNLLPVPKKLVLLEDKNNTTKIRLLSKLADADEVQGVDGAQELSVQKLLDAPSTGATSQLAASVEVRKKSIQELNLLPSNPWYTPIEKQWEIGEKAAQKKLIDFLNHGLLNYTENRDYPDKTNFSKLSPHLHFGEISPHQIWHTTQKKAIGISNLKKDGDHFLRALVWREFSYSMLYHFPDLPSKNFKAKFDHFPWQHNDLFLKAWQKGQTGYPLVDAGMRELWQTGTMHNRVRMIAASFLVKNLLIDWRHGEAWFWDCLLDADLASNSFNWQWVAGSGADASPYFRIFNPTTQGERFDKEGHYTRRFVPEISQLPNRFLFKPWEAPDSVLTAAGIILGETYPQPIINLQDSRDRALDAYFTSLQ